MTVRRTRLVVTRNIGTAIARVTITEDSNISELDRGDIYGYLGKYSTIQRNDTPYEYTYVRIIRVVRNSLFLALLNAVTKLHYRFGKVILAKFETSLKTHTDRQRIYTVNKLIIRYNKLNIDEPKYSIGPFLTLFTFSYSMYGLAIKRVEATHSGG